MSRRGITVGIDASAALLGSGGIPRYVRELTRALAGLAGDDLELVVLINSLRHSDAEFEASLRGSPGVRVIRRAWPGPLVVQGWRLLGQPSWELLTGAPADVVHGPAGYLPPSASPTVLTIHDLDFLGDDGDRGALGGAYFRAAMPGFVRRCAAIVAPSQHVAREVEATWPEAAGKTHAVWSGIDRARWRHTPPSAAFSARHQLPGRYVLAVTDWAPRKRWELLREVCGSLSPELPVVVVGLHGGSGFPPGCRLLPRVDDAELAMLYSGAVCTLLTTRAEGFGFPLLESLACGTPVVCGRHSSLAEIGGEFADYAGGDTAADFAAALRRVADRDRAAPVAGLEEWLAEFTWEATARRMGEVYRSLCKP